MSTKSRDQMINELLDYDYNGWSHEDLIKEIKKYKYHDKTTEEIRDRYDDITE